MFYKKIESLIDKSPFVLQFDSLLKDQINGILIHNLNSSAKSLMMARAFKKKSKNIIFVTSDDKAAEDYLEDFKLLIGENSAFFLPDFEVLPYEERSPHYSIRGQRIDTLSQIVTGKKNIYTLSIRSFLRKIVDPETFKKNIITIEKGEDYDPDLLVSNLVGMGYQVEYQVSRVGEVARRGGIIDIFSANQHYPLRIEFWGDEITSIRPFSIASQKSTGKELSKVILIPSREFSLHNIDTTEEMWEKIHEKGFYEGIELDVSLLLKKTSSFIDYFDSNEIIIFFDEYQYFSSYLQEIKDETSNLWTKARTKKKQRNLPDPDKLFEDKNFLKDTILTYQTHFLSSSYQSHPEISFKLEAPILSQTSMHSDLEMFERVLNERIQDDYQIFIQSDNKSQSKRMRELLPDDWIKINYSLGVLQKGFNFTDIKLAIFTDHEIFSRYRRKKHQTKFSKDEALVDYDSLKPGDYIVHINYGIGIFEGLRTLTVDGNKVECLSITYAGNDKIYVPTYQLQFVSRFVSEEGFLPSIHKLGGKKWASAKAKAKKHIELIAEDLVNLYAERKLRKGIACQADTTWQTEMEDAFIYEDTPDQVRATNEIKQDMEANFPMERLLCGDVGFGKTEVAIRAAFKSVVSGFQVAILVPTTLLAEQHYQVFRDRLAQYPVEIAMFSRFRSKANMKKDLARITTGEIDIAIGTHRLISKDIVFKRIGLLIIDEEHKFGVRHKDKIRKFKSNVDTLYMSATPIPRTLNMALSRLKEMSLMQTSPKARLPIRSVIVPYDEEIIKDAINREIDRGGQVFFVHNRVQTIDSVASGLRKLMPKVSFIVGHGQMKEKQLESVMLDFSNHKYDVLIATTIIENGIDIPNANTIIVNRADNFGLAQLYQMRGRVGRSNRRAYAYLIIPNKIQEIARKRLEALTDYEYLGAGYQIAIRDMEIRGAGSLLGTKQSGAINSLGFNYYNRLLERAVKNIEEKNPNGIWDEESIASITNIRIESDHYLPAEFINDEKVRLEIYKRLLEFKESEEFDQLIVELKDRFGSIPEPAKQAIIYYKLRHFAKTIGLASFKIRNGVVIIEFSSKKLPNKKNLTELISNFDYPVSFESTGNLKVKFTISSNGKISKTEIGNKSIKILEFIEKWG